MAPQEGTSNGIFIIDKSIAGLGEVDKPVKITVKDGFATKIEGGTSATQFLKMLESVNDKNAFNIAELGIGTNDKAKIIGNVLEDEKVLGTIHIALGNNTAFGGSIKVPIHIDGVISKPTIFVDNKKIMENGKLLI